MKTAQEYHAILAHIISKKQCYRPSQTSSFQEVTARSAELRRLEQQVERLEKRVQELERKVEKQPK